MAETWYAYHRSDTGELVSVGTENDAALAPVPVGVTRIVAEAPRDARRWNPGARAFEDVPALTLADKLALVAVRAAAWNALVTAVSAAASDSAFSATERARLVTARDLARDALRAII